MQRLFFGIDLPSSIKQQLNWTLKGDISGARWVRENQQHLTLLFLGDVPNEKYPEIIRLGEELTFSPFTLRLRGLDFFGRGKNPKVLYLGVEENEELMNLQSEIEKKVLNLGFEIEKRKYTPHVTLARLRTPDTHKLGTFLENNALVSFDPFEVIELTLFESRLDEKGSEYFPRERFAF